jgi:hypothetical protein
MMKSDFPLDHERVRGRDDSDDGFDEFMASDEFVVFDSDSSDDEDDEDGSMTSETEAQEVSVPFAMPTLKIGPMLLSRDETKDEEFLRSVCMEDPLDFIDYRFEDRGATKGKTLSPAL